MSKRRDTLTQLNKILPVPIELYNPEEETVDHHENGTDTTHPETATAPGEGGKKSRTIRSHITNVIVGDYHVVEGEGGISFTTWAIKVILDDSEYTSILVYKRYSDIEQFQQDLKHAHPKYSHSVPELPPKNSFSIERITMSSRWLEDRRRGLQWFLSNVLLNPVFQQSEVVRAFILG